MANYGVKMGQQKDIILSPIRKQHQSNLSKGFSMLFRVHHIVQRHRDCRLTIKTSEKLLDVDSDIFLAHRDTRILLSDVIYNILQLHVDSHDRFLSHRGDGVQLVLDGLFDNKPTPVDLKEMFIVLFLLYSRRLERNYNYKKSGNRIVPVVIDCEIVRYHQFIDLNEAIAWWESTPINAHDMVPATNSSPSLYAEYKIKRLSGQVDVMEKEVVRQQRKEQCAICLEEFQLGMEVATLYCWHSFHKHCIRHWFKRSCTCPVCRLLLD